MSGPTALVITPDFPPQHGGIQILVSRVVAGWTRLCPRVVAVSDAAAPAADAGQRFDVSRTPEIRAVRKLTIAALNQGALVAGLRHRPDVVLSAHIVTSPAAVAIQKAIGVPYVQYFHAKEIGAKPALARFAATRSAACVAVSRYTGGLLTDLGVDPARIRRISPGVDLPPAAGPRPQGPPTILTVARLEDRYKGHDVVLRALPLVRARVPDVRWAVIGDGPLRAGLEQLAYAEGVADSVRFLGRVDDALRDEWFDRADVFTMPSRLPAGGFAGEGFGIVYLEANAHAVPVVAGAVGGAVDAVRHGETGLLVDPTDHVAVAEALSSLLLDRERARTLGAAGRRWAEAHDWTRVSRDVEDLMLEVAAP